VAAGMEGDMSKELVISSNRHETRVALIEDDQLVEVYFQRANEYSLAGSIHKGRVTRVLPGMQSAFVDLGLERDTFLYVSDFLEENEDFDRITGDERAPRERDRRPPPAFSPAPPAAHSSPAPPPPIASAAPAAIEPGVAPVSEGAPQSASLDRPGERNDDRDRRGRRSRRRRNRGRGFPESKYASESAPLAAAPAETPVERASEPEESATPPIILPGESLAKYRSPAEPSSARGRVPAQDLESEYDEPIHYPPENAMPDAPVHQVVPPEAAPAMAGLGATELGLPPEPAAIAEEDEAEAEEHEEADSAAEAGPAVAPMLDEEEDRDIQEMILGRAEDLEGASEEEMSEDEMSAEETSEAGEPVESAGGAAEPTEGATEPRSGTAEVRERGGRYPHRVARRTRRRGRGGPGFDQGRDQNRDQSRDQTRDQTRDQGRDQNRDQNRDSRAPGAGGERTISRPVAGGMPSIADLLKEGQEIIVQIAKEPLGQKGARITSHIALPGRYVVYMPTLEHMGVSRKIASDEERLRLKRILQGRRPGTTGGFITRTAAEGRSEEEIAADMAFLYNLWTDIKNKADRRPAPMLLHHDLDIVQRILRDQLADSFKAIWIDNEEAYESVLRFVERFQPALVGKVKLYTREAPIFDAFSVTAELEKALRPKVWLKSGGFIVINQTEALVAIDVNTGKYVGKTNRLEDTIVKTNTEAIKEIVRQIRLRDLGGIIVIDFIDMDERKNRQKVMQTLEEAMRVDRAPYKILQFNDFGLVAITRKRVKQSLERTLSVQCNICQGTGMVKSPATVCNEIYVEMRKMQKSFDHGDVLLRVHPDVVKTLKEHNAHWLTELEEMIGKNIIVKSDPSLHPEQFDIH
jgi:ribonuclease G